MSNQIKQAVNKIEVSQNLHERSKTGIMKAKSEMKKPKRKWFYLGVPIIAAALAFIFISPSNEIISGKPTIEQSSEGNAVDSYVALLKINGDVYRLVDNKNPQEYTLSNEIGKIEEKVAPEVIPEADLASNFLEKGTLIYSVKEDSNVLLAGTEEKGVYKVFEKTTIGK